MDNNIISNLVTKEPKLVLGVAKKKKKFVVCFGQQEIIRMNDREYISRLKLGPLLNTIMGSSLTAYYTELVKLRKKLS